MSFPTSADHLPDSKLAHGKDELILADVEIFKTSIPTIRRKFGKPSRQSELSPAHGDVTGEKLYVWQKPDIRIQIGTMFATKPTFKGGLAETVYFISVDGSDGEIGRTGRGLKLGDPYSAVAKTYGPRFVKNGRRLTIEWKTTTRLEVGWNKDGIVNHITLLGPE